MTTSPTTGQFIVLLLIGGILGMTGQAIRVIVGLKKTYDQSARDKTDFADLFNGSSLVISLLIGFAAGILGVLSMNSLCSENGGDCVSRQSALTLIAIGYAGADFIEGFVKKYLPSDGSDGGSKTADTTKTNSSANPSPPDLIIQDESANTNPPQG